MFTVWCSINHILQMIPYLIGLEWKKMYSNRLFQVLIGLYFIVLPLSFLIGRNINLPPETGGTISFYTFPKVWQALGYAGNWMTFFFLGFLGVVMLTNEFSYKTLRQNIITGMSRSQYFWGKILFMLLLSSIATIYYVIVALAIGYTYTEVVVTERVWLYPELIPRFFLMAFAYMNFAFMLGILIRRSGLALFLYFIYALCIEMILRWWLHAKLFGYSNIYKNYYPLNAFEDLVPFPIVQMIPKHEETMNFFLSPTEAVLLSIGYTVLFLMISYRIFLKKDL